MRRAVVLLAVAVLVPRPAAAEASPHDIQVISRAAGFMEGGLSGAVEFGIVFPDDSAAGRVEAEQLATAIGQGVRGGALTLKPRLVPISEVARSDLPVLLLTEAALPAAARIAAATAGRRVLTVMAGTAGIDGGKIVMAVTSRPQIEIVVNRAAAQAAGIAFAPAFRMMIRER